MTRSKPKTKAKAATPAPDPFTATFVECLADIDAEAAATGVAIDPDAKRTLAFICALGPRAMQLYLTMRNARRELEAMIAARADALTDPQM